MNFDTLVKAAGWQPIPGGRKGGERRRTSAHGGGWEYRYQDKPATQIGLGLTPEEGQIDLFGGEGRLTTEKVKEQESRGQGSLFGDPEVKQAIRIERARIEMLEQLRNPNKPSPIAEVKGTRYAVATEKRPPAHAKGPWSHQDTYHIYDEKRQVVGGAADRGRAEEIARGMWQKRFLSQQKAAVSMVRSGASRGPFKLVSQPPLLAGGGTHPYWLVTGGSGDVVTAGQGGDEIRFTSERDAIRFIEQAERAK